MLIFLQLVKQLRNKKFPTFLKFETLGVGNCPPSFSPKFPKFKSLKTVPVWSYIF